MRWLKSIFIILCASLYLIQPAAAQEAVSVKSGSFIFTEWNGPAIEVHYAEPSNAAPDAPIIIVMHGATRKPASYRDGWKDLAAQYGFVVYAPEFKKKDFPGSSYYQLGGLTKDDLDDPNDRAGSFYAIEPLFDELKRRRGAPQDYYYLFGHSAGGQFVHRYVLFIDDTRYKKAYAANAGWYTMPTEAADWPYGLEGLKSSRYDNMRDVFKRPLVILLGDKDTDTKHKQLRTTKEAMLQGPHRYARGISFIKTAKAAAKKSRMKLKWGLAVVPNVAHSQEGMAKAAAQLIAAEEQK